MLKFELSEARVMPVLLGSDCDSTVNLHKVLEKADAALRVRAIDAARDLADEALLPRILGPSWRSAAAELQDGVRLRRGARHNGKAVLRC